MQYHGQSECIVSVYVQLTRVFFLFLSTSLSFEEDAVPSSSEVQGLIQLNGIDKENFQIISILMLI